MERVLEPLASGLGNAVAWLAETGVLFAVFAAIWISLGVGLVWRAETVDEAWRTIGAMRWIVQGVAWILLLPVMIGLWIWESSWPVLVRVLLVVGIGGWNLLVFLPRSMRATT